MVELLKNVKLYSGGCDLTGAGNKIDVTAEVEEKDVTTWGDYDPATDRVWKAVQAGTASAKLTGGGFWEAGDPSKVDDALWGQLGGVGAWSAVPRGAAVGDLAWLTQALQGQYQLLGGVGDVAPWQASWSSRWPLVRGVLAHPPGTARTGTGAGNAVEHVAVPAGSHLYATLHVLSVAGEDAAITVAIESDTTGDFGGSESTRIEFDEATAIGGQAARAAGPITDTFYRVTWTISGTDPSFLFVVALGVA